MADETAKVLPENEEEKELFSWISPERVFKIRTKEFYSTILVLGVLVGIIFFFIEGIMPVLVVAAIVFVVFAISKTPPGMVAHKITSKGVRVAGDLVRWDELVMFWLEEKSKPGVLYFLTVRTFPRQLAMVLPSEETEVSSQKVKQELMKRLPMQQLPPSWVDKAVKWLGEKLPLEE